MAITFDRALGVHESALKLRSERASVLANNLANADTPGFKAKDIDFKSVLNGQSQLSKSTAVLQRTHDNHFGDQQAMGEYETLFRVPLQPSIDGNTVEEQVENAEYMKNSMAFQASFTFLNSKFKGLTQAIKGE
jgi:flagellar basal-body rod protein FlgB